jgi:Fur family ferric uptake transcriptional regulator
MILNASMVSMTSHPGELERLVGFRLGEQEIRFTAARRLVVRTLGDASGPLSAAEIHDLIREDVPLSSLYRTLAVLEEHGVLHRQHASDAVARYELAEWLKGHHHHLVCVRCGEVADIAIDHELEHRVGVIVTALARDRDWRVSGHRIDIEGICPACRKT